MTYICGMLRFLIGLFLMLPGVLLGQNRIGGQLWAAGKPMAGAHIRLAASTAGTVSDKNGRFVLNDDKFFPWRLQISAIGFLPIDTLISTATNLLVFHLKPDVLGLEQVVVSANREAIAQRDAPVLVQVVDRRLLNSIQAVDVASGLNFMPGVRTENNCQNCGFTSVRLNGLPGAYSQILINSRPVFSALAGVYGLEQLPAAMIERIEVVRGGGSALYGGNAVAGTINLITREVLSNSLEASLQSRLIGGVSPENLLQLSGSRVDEFQTKGLTVYGQHRQRQEFDANGDGFSELTRLSNYTLGTQAFWKPDKYRKLLFNAHYIDEFRRGGNKFDLLPHQTDITEQLDHKIAGGLLQYDLLSKNFRNKWSFYGSAQYTRRGSYYGGGGRIIAPGDTLTTQDLLALNAYGNATDLAAVGGLTFQRYVNDELSFVGGMELIYNQVNDRIPGYNRIIDQQVVTFGSFGQLQYKKGKHTLLAGVRWDRLAVKGAYTLFDTSFSESRPWSVPVPRLSWMFQPNEHWRTRLSYARGYRAPQAFDEDLHLETVGGAARMTSFAPNLLTERSQNYTASIDFADYWKDRPVNVVLDFFLTQLSDPFVWSEPVALPNGISLLQKNNGPGVQVRGLNLEFRMAEGDRWLVQSSITWQRSSYEEPLLVWSGNYNGSYTAVLTKRLLRSPDLYGYVQGNYRFNRHWNLTLLGNFTGGMWVPHVIDPQTEYTEVKFTAPFADLGFRVSYDFFLGRTARLTVNLGVDNVLNSYQRDFDTGATRDANYVYGPALPRSLMASLRFSY